MCKPPRAILEVPRSSQETKDMKECNYTRQFIVWCCIHAVIVGSYVVVYILCKFNIVKYQKGRTHVKINKFVLPTSLSS